MKRPRGPRPLTVARREQDGVIVLSARGELDLATASRMTAALDSCRAGGAPARVLVDLTELDFCDSTGLRALLGAAIELRRAGGRLTVCAGTGPVARLLEISGAEEWMDVRRDVSAGLHALA